jgi:hypothetical protein
MSVFHHPPSIGAVPTLADGAPPPPDVQEQVVTNQVRTATQWNDTAEDIAVSNLINEREQVRQTHWLVFAVGVIAVLVCVFGIWWTYNSRMHDRLLASERAAAQQTPYTPETIR